MEYFFWGPRFKTSSAEQPQTENNKAKVSRNKAKKNGSRGRTKDLSSQASFLPSLVPSKITRDLQSQSKQSSPVMNTPPKREFLERKKTESEGLRDIQRERRGSTKQNTTPRQWKMHQSKYCGVQKSDQRFSLYALCARLTAIGHHYEGLRRRRPQGP